MHVYGVPCTFIAYRARLWCTVHIYSVPCTFIVYPSIWLITEAVSAARLCWTSKFCWFGCLITDKLGWFGEGILYFSKRILHRVRSSASCFNFQNRLVSLRSSNSCLRLLTPVPFTPTFSSITMFLRYMWQIQLSFLPFTVIFFFFNLCSSSFLTRSHRPISSVLLQHHVSKKIS